MKIMYVDASTDGHHLTYLNYLLQAASRGSFAVIPKDGEKVRGRVREISAQSIRSFRDYGTWMKELRRIAKEEKPDIIHFLDGDTMMRNFGRGLSCFKDSRIVITFHHLFEGKAREFSMKRMLGYAAAGVFHTEEIRGKVVRMGCRNTECVPYPCFLDAPMGESGKYQNNPPVLLALGGTRYDKGLDILLEALRLVEEPFRLVIAGKPEDFGEEFIRQRTEPYSDRVKFHLHFLSEEEVKSFLMEADIIALPYRKIFDGASGPMCEGIYLGKTIVGPDHGSLGELIRQSHTGYVFESENVDKLASCLNYALHHPCLYDLEAQKAQQELKPELFAQRYMHIYDKVLQNKGR